MKIEIKKEISYKITEISWDEICLFYSAVTDMKTYTTEGKKLRDETLDYLHNIVKEHEIL